MMDSDIPTIHLGGANYSIPPIPFEYASKIVPAVMTKPDIMTEAGYQQIGQIIFNGIRASLSSYTWEAFTQGHYVIEELMDAVRVISRQAGLKAKEPATGEATGAMSPQISKS